MKISNASKKVLASALSAAMVVAFAPTVAFAAVDNGVDVKVTFDLNGGEVNNTITDAANMSSLPYEIYRSAATNVAGEYAAASGVAIYTAENIYEEGSNDAVAASVEGGYYSSEEGGALASNAKVLDSSKTYYSAPANGTQDSNAKLTGTTAYTCTIAPANGTGINLAGGLSQTVSCGKI